MASYNHIDYSKHPFFNVGRVDQWGEQGYFLYEGKVYFFIDDRHDGQYSIQTPRSPQDFLDFAKKKRISIPKDFKDLLLEVINNKP